MPDRQTTRREIVAKHIVLAVLGLLFGLTILPGKAQTDGVNLAQTAEYDIGFDCPVSAALNPDGTSLWVLMNSCGVTRYSLRAFNVADGSPINDENSNFADELTALDDQWVDSFVTPLAFTPDGDLSILYNDAESYNLLGLRVSVASDAGVSTLETDTLNILVRGFTDYPEATIYNPDHTLAAVTGEDSIHVIDLLAESELLQINAPGEAFSFFPTFSAERDRVYIAELNNPDDMEDSSAVLHVYSLPDSALLADYDVPSFILWISPDGRYAAAQLGDEALAVIELATGSISEALPIVEPPSKVTECLNTGNDVSDVDFTRTGRLFLADLEWLPDSSGFVTVHSYRGEGSSGGCIFDYSRLRHYAVQPGG